jgi:hypothetical protein
MFVLMRGIYIVNGNYPDRHAALYTKVLEALSTKGQKKRR